MFISVGHLENRMGVNKIIGRFFVDRRLPKNNSFWKDKLLYIGIGNGYVSIPVFYDILYRIGIPMEILLDERHVELMERLMHFAILQEKNEISYAEELKNIRDLLQGRIQHQEYFEALNRYLEQDVLKPLGNLGTVFPSLNRADVFLYILCDLPMNEKQREQAIRYWYLLHPSYLIMDDIRDYSKDKKEGEENVVIDLGQGTDGFEKALEMLLQNGESMKEINPLLGGYLMNYEEKLRKWFPVKI